MSARTFNANNIKDIILQTEGSYRSNGNTTINVRRTIQWIKYNTVPAPSISLENYLHIEPIVKSLIKKKLEKKKKEIGKKIKKNKIHCNKLK